MGVTLMAYLDRTCLSVAAPTLKKQLSINAVQYSYIVFAFQLPYILTQPFVGRIIDWLNIRVGLALSIAWWSIAQMLTGFALSWQAFAAFRVLLAFGEAGNFPSGAKVVAQWFRPGERSMATGIFNVGAGLGQVIATPAVAFIILWYNWQLAFVITGAVGLIWVALWLLLYRTPEEHPWMSPEELAHIREGQAAVAVHDEPDQKGVWKVVLGQRNFWGIAAARFMSEPAWAFMQYWPILYLSDVRHMNLKAIGYFAWLPFIAGDFGCLFGGVMGPIFNKLGASVITARKLAASVCAVLMVGAIFIGTAPTVAWAIFFFCVGAFAHQAMSSTLLTLPADLFPKRTVATANGLSGMIGGAGGMLFNLIVGRVVMTTGYGPLFVAMAFFDLIGAAFLWSLVRDRSAQPEATTA
jgi:ACS family hexuronate transporter-like MFS transporter